jgi:hypothetical protein
MVIIIPQGHHTAPHADTIPHGHHTSRSPYIMNTIHHVRHTACVPYLAATAPGGQHTHGDHISRTSCLMIITAHDHPEIVFKMLEHVHTLGQE